MTTGTLIPPAGDTKAGEENLVSALAESKTAQDALSDAHEALEGLREIAERVSGEGLKEPSVPGEAVEGQEEPIAPAPEEREEKESGETPASEAIQTSLPLFPPKKLKVGERLKAARLENGFSLEEVAAEVKIKTQHLEALEEGHYGDLPSRTYALGFVRSYAHALGLPVDEMAEQCRQETAFQAPPRFAPISVPAAATENPLPSASIVLLCALLAFVIYVVGYAFFRPAVTSAPAPEQVLSTAPAPVAAPAATVGAPSAAPAAAVPAAGPSAAEAPKVEAPKVEAGPPSSPVPAVAPPPAPAEEDLPMPQDALSDDNPPLEQPEIDTTNVAPGLLQKEGATPLQKDPAGTSVPPALSRIKLRATGDATVQIFDAFGKLIAERSIARGEAFYVPDKAGYTMATSNAGSVHVQIDGREMAPLGEDGEAMHNIPLNADSLLKYLQ